MEPDTRHAERLLFVGTLVLFAGAWWLHAKPLMASEQAIYVEYAHRVVNGTFFPAPPTDLFAQRLGVVLPVAVSLGVFGLGEGAAHLWPLLTCLLVLWGTWMGSPSGWCRSVAVLLLATGAPLFLAATTILPDSVATAGMTLSVALLVRRSAWRTPWSRSAAGLAAGLALVLAASAKLNAYWALPVWAFALARDAVRGRAQGLRGFYASALAAGAVATVGLGLAYRFTWGSFLSRLGAVEATASLHLWGGGDPSGLSERMLDLLPFLATLAGVSGPFALLGLWIVFRSGDGEGRVGAGGIEAVDGGAGQGTEVDLWAVYLLGAAVLFVFGPTSLGTYAPLPLIPRMALPLLPATAVLAGVGVAGVASRRAVPKWAPAALALLLGLTALATRATSLQAACVGTIGVLGLFHARGRLGRLAGLLSTPRLAALGALVLTLPVVALVRASAPSPAGAAMRQVAEYAEHLDRVVLLTADTRSPSYLRFYFDYAVPPTLDIRYLAELDDPASLSADAVLVYVNRERSNRFWEVYGEPDLSAAAESLTSGWLFTEGHVSLGLVERRATP